MIISNFSLNLLILLLLSNQIYSETISISLSDLTTDVSNNNYEYISTTKVLTLNKNIEYQLTGSCSECQISIAKSTEMTITLQSIKIDNSNTGPFVIAKSAKVNLILEGESSIIDNEDIANENEDSFEGAGIKFKASSSLTISGSGTLEVKGIPKNGIKGGKKSTLTINSGTLKISASKNALACDNLLTINDGTINIISESDGIKSEPDSDDDDSKGTIIINGGTITIYSQSDGIQAAYKLEINGGIFYINTYEGAYSTNFDSDTMSAKGLKCSTDEHANITNQLIINGGEFYLNTSDDAVHSDYNVTITKGIFNIITKDDGIHADQYLILGQKGQTDNTLLKITIKKSYEGLEGSQVYIYSGTYYVIASDDGINAAGDTDENCQTGGNTGPGQGGMGPGNNPGGMGPGGNFGPRYLQNSQCYTFHIYIYGGDIYVNTESDGLDANGNIYITGGNLEVWGMSSGGDGDPIDMDGTLYITGGTVLAGGSQGMEPIHQSANTISQNFIYSTKSYSANKVISIKSGDETIRTITIPKQINYLFYTSSDTNSNYKFSDGSTSYQTGSNSVNFGTSNSGNNDDKSDVGSNNGYFINNYLVISFLFIFMI